VVSPRVGEQRRDQHRERIADGHHLVYVNVSGSYATQIRLAMTNYTSVPDPSTSMELLLTNQPGVNAVAWTQFMAPEGSIGVQYGDIDPRNWCRPSETFYNPAFGQNDFPADNPKRYIACHQPRHTIGLRHSNESIGSCMISATITPKYVPTFTTTSGHDRNHILAWY